jgi:hypothetical protein
MSTTTTSSYPRFSELIFTSYLNSHFEPHIRLVKSCLPSYFFFMALLHFRAENPKARNFGLFQK